MITHEWAHTLVGDVLTARDVWRDGVKLRGNDVTIFFPWTELKMTSSLVNPKIP